LPTIAVFVGVGRVYERIKLGIQSKIEAQPFYKRWIVQTIYHIKSFVSNNFGLRSLPVLDQIFESV
jgi:long-subunit acyl-CoA synthetase (AMP-forming)